MEHSLNADYWQKTCRVYLNNTNVSPGFGFHYLTRETTQDTLFEPLQHMKSMKKFVKLSHIVSFIKTGVVQWNNDFVSFENLSKTQISTDFINSFSDLNLFLGKNGLSLVNELQASNEESEKVKTSFLKSLVFDDSVHSFFINAVTESGNWSLKNPMPLCQNTEQSEFKFRKKFGECYVKSVTLGKMALFKIDFEKTDLEGFANLKQKLSETFHPVGIVEGPFDLFALDQLPPYTVSVLFCPGDMPSKIDNLLSVINSISSLAKSSKSHPEVLYADVSFYDETTVRPNFMAGFRDTVLNAESVMMPRFFDLYQCSQYFNQAVETEQSEVKRKEMIDAQKEMKLHMLTIVKKIEDLSTTCWSPDLPNVPIAIDVLRKYPALGYAQEANEGERCSFDEDIDEIKHLKLSTTPEKLERVFFNNQYTMMMMLHKALKQYRQRNINIPLYVFIPAQDSDAEPEYNQRTAFGIGCLVHQPETPQALLKMLKKENEQDREYNAFYKYVKVYKVENSDKTLIHKATFNGMYPKQPIEAVSTSAEPRAISMIDKHSYILHKAVTENSIKADIEESTKIMGIISSEKEDSEGHANRTFLNDFLDKAFSDYKVLNKAKEDLACGCVKVYQGLQQFVYGPRAWSEIMGQDLNMIKDMKKELILARNSKFCESTDKIYPLMSIITNLELLRGLIEEKEKELYDELTVAEMKLYEVRISRYDDKRKLLSHFQQIKNYLQGYHNSIPEDPKLDHVQTFELVYDGSLDFDATER